MRTNYIFLRLLASQELALHAHVILKDVKQSEKTFKII
jgi:hypothetical protein